MTNKLLGWVCIDKEWQLSLAQQFAAGCVNARLEITDDIIKSNFNKGIKKKKKKKSVSHLSSRHKTFFSREFLTCNPGILIKIVCLNNSM